MKANFALKALFGIELGIVLCSYNGSSEPISEEMRTFYEQLDPDAKAKFKSMDTPHRKKAMGIVEHYCKANNECKGHRESEVRKEYIQQQRERLQADAPIETQDTKI